MNQENGSPVLLIGLDAAEASLIDQLCAEGKLPTLERLRRNGCFGRLTGSADLFAGGVWPTMYTGKDVPWHGIYHNKLWRPAEMRCDVANAAWLPEPPFWAQLDSSYRVALVDIPMTVGAPFVANGIQLSGWGTHDMVVRGAWPDTLWQQLRQSLGPPAMAPELYGPQSGRTLAYLRDMLLRTTEQMAQLCEHLLDREYWDLFFVVLGATHRGGHYLWDLSQIDRKALTPAMTKILEQALIEIYQACDQAVARLVERMPHARVLVFAVHGMGPNQGWAERCDDIVARIQQVEMGQPARTSLLYRVKRRLPWQLARQVTTRLPTAVLNRLVTLWSTDMYDWSTTRSFPLPMDHAGYLRINLLGRERDGIVKPGTEYDALCDILATAMRGFRDLETGAPIVDDIVRGRDLALPGAPYIDGLPDLIVTWNTRSTTRSRGVRSEQYGVINWGGAGRLPSGRAGNHRADGWFVATGPQIQPGATTENQRTIDIVPTILDWLGADPLPHLQGQPIVPGTDHRPERSRGPAAEASMTR